MNFLSRLQRAMPYLAISWSSLTGGIVQEGGPEDEPYMPADEGGAKRVKIGSVVLGIRDFANPDWSQPNPNEIKWWRDFNVVEHHVVGHKPLTQCTEPEALWHCSIRLVTLADQDTSLSHLSKKLQILAGMNAGPWWIEDSFTTHGPMGGKLCMYMKRPEFTQKAGTKDWYRVVDLQFVEANDGLSDEAGVIIEDAPEA